MRRISALPAAYAGQLVALQNALRAAVIATLLPGDWMKDL